MSEEVKVTQKIKLVRYIQGKEYPIIIEVKEDGTMRVNVSKHGGSNEQLSAILKDLSAEFGTTFEVEKHIHHHHNHTHTHDDNLEKIEE